MGRTVKECYDWSLTWSPEEDVTDWPEFLEAWMSSSDIKRCVAVLERHSAVDKWHLHIGFTYFRSYKSDYKWWQAACTKAGLVEPALQIKYHDNILGLVGGYVAKAEEGDRKLLFKKGFTDEQLEHGEMLYQRGLRRQRVRTFVEKHLVINPNKFECAVGAQMAELGCNEAEAIVQLAEDGWTFAQSKKGITELYRDVYSLQRTMLDEQVETSV